MNALFHKNIFHTSFGTCHDGWIFYYSYVPTVMSLVMCIPLSYLAVTPQKKNNQQIIYAMIISRFNMNEVIAKGQ